MVPFSTIKYLDNLEIKSKSNWSTMKNLDGSNLDGLVRSVNEQIHGTCFKFSIAVQRERKINNRGMVEEWNLGRTTCMHL